MRVEQVFDRGLTEVVSDFARYFMVHPDRNTVYQGRPRILGLRSVLTSTLQFFEVEEAIAYTDEYTQSRWRNSRAVEIANVPPATVLVYGFRGTDNLFIKTQESANIQPYRLRRVNFRGEPIPGDENALTTSYIAPTLGLRHGDRGSLTEADFRGRQAFILSASAGGLSPEELRQIEEEILRLAE